MLLSWVFRIFGPSIFVARLLAVGFGLTLYLALYHLVKIRSNKLSAMAAVFFLAAAPAILQLSASVMLEVPAIAIALGSAYCLFEWVRRKQSYWLVASGTIMGVALQIKLTAVMVAPAICLEIMIVIFQSTRAVLKDSNGNLIGPKTSSRFLSVYPGLIWCATTTLVFLVIGMFFGKGSLASSWQSHTGHQIISGLGSPANFPFQFSMLLKHFECLAGSVFAIIFLCQQKRWYEMRFPLILLATSFAVHLLHRPWWSYYYLHFAIPLAWLCGIAFSDLLMRISALLPRMRSAKQSSVRWRFVSLALMTGLVFVISEMRLEGNIRKLRASSKINDNQLVNKIRQYAGRTNWIYSEPPIYAFHAGLLVPPELAVIVLKRFWSGQTSTSEIIEVCRKYKTEQIVLYKSKLTEKWYEFLTSERYVGIIANETSVMYVTRELEL